MTIVLPGRQPFDDVVQQLQALRNAAVDASNRLRRSYISVPREDPRVEVGRHLKAVTSTTWLMAIHVAANLSRPAWWRGTGLPGVELQEELDDYVTALPNILIVFTYSLFEAGVRRIARQLWPSASGREDAAGPLLSRVLRELRRGGWDEYQEADEFLHLFRLVRNSVHNNGMHFPQRRRNETVTWLGSSYAFRYGEKLDFMNWDVEIALVRHLIMLNESVMTAPAIRALPAFA